MKKRIIASITLSGVIILSACGNSSADSDDFKSPTLSSATTTATVSSTAEPTTAAEATTEAVQAEADYSPADLVGEWVQQDTGNILTVRDDATFSLKYVYGGTRFGTVKIESEENPDGSRTYWYSFCEDDTPWASFVCPEKPFSEIYSEDEGGMTFARNDSGTYLAPTIPEAKDIRDALAFADKLMSGVAIATDESAEYTADDGTVYHKSADALYTSTADVRSYLSIYMTEQFISSTYGSLFGTDSPKCIDVDGELYIQYSPVGGKYSFTDDDPTVTETAEGYSINIKNYDYGAENTVAVYVVKDNGIWKINGVDNSF